VNLGADGEVRVGEVAGLMGGRIIVPSIGEGVSGSASAGGVGCPLPPPAGAGAGAGAGAIAGARSAGAAAAAVTPTPIVLLRGNVSRYLQHNHPSYAAQRVNGPDVRACVVCVCCVRVCERERERERVFFTSLRTRVPVTASSLLLACDHFGIQLAL
jgi:hypothetical protein